MPGFEDLGESDWADEDLLTHDEASARLREEIAAEEARLGRAGGEESSSAVRGAERRLAAMRRRLERIDAAPASGAGAVPSLDRPA
ncbi:MAG TPA: hypothetical protein VLT58_11710 [Polyangia bacterium]|nr:hypothetical protein [Polyangia bacterium]